MSNMMDDKDLGPCPWCHTEEARLEQLPMDDAWYVGCKTCGATGPTKETERDAGFAWNLVAYPMEIYKRGEL